MHVSSITFEHHPTGFGIGHAKPRISWRFSTDDDAKNWVQNYYEIQIGRQDRAEAKTYRVESSESVLVPWPDDALQSRESAWVKVRSHGQATDAAGQVTTKSTEWSSTATVEAALLDRDDWTAKLATSALRSDEDKSMRPVTFRRVFPLPEQSGAISKARLYITAHGVYEAFLNGQRIGREEMAPGWTSYRHRLLYQTFDVRTSLVSGKLNTFGIEVAEGWFAGRLGMDGKRHFYGSRTAILAQLEVLFENGETYTLVSDSTWKSHESATTRSRNI